MSLLLPAAHAAFVACAMLVGGVAFFGTFVLPRAVAGAAERALVRRLVPWATAGGLLALAAWTLAETVDMAGTPGAIGTVLAHTLFGHLVLLQAAFLLAAVTATRWGFAPACIPAALVLLAEAAHGHGMAMGQAGWSLVAAGIVHLLAAAVWVGGLLPLLLVVRAAPLAVAARAARWFSPPGKLAVAAVALSALVQTVWLVGTPAALLATRYGVLVLVKAALFASLLAGACLNRYAFAPALRGDRPADARRRLVATILFQTACGIAAILAAVLLGASTPGMDMQRR